MLIRPGIELANLTDTGCERTENEDYYCYAEPADAATYERLGRLAVVADGMGGHAGGQVASGIAVDVVRERYFSAIDEDPAEALQTAFSEAHAEIQRRAFASPALHGMGTTCTAAAVRDHHLYFGHVGDSRLYLLRNGAIARLTRDHSVVGRLVEQGVITPEEAAARPDRNVLTSALGMEAPIEADFSQDAIALNAGDVLLIATDGLHGLVADDEILTVAAGAAPRQACIELVRMAKERGGHDNITLQILRVSE
jgi:serine/threonine protein phosphatase PrpC